MTINLISDTVTKPTDGMRSVMSKAEVGDDVFRMDPTVNKLEEYAADLFGMEAALYCPSGTMTNQIAIKCHTNPLDEIICDYTSHVYQYETAGYAFHSGVGVNLLNGNFGKITPSLIQDAIKQDFDWLPKSKLVVIENSCNKGGGSFYTIDEVKEISSLCKENNLRLHVDGARIFNVFAETGESPNQYGKLVDSISICTSKGLGAPVGSLLIGKKDFIAKARKFRKVMGGGMRQAGIIASGSLYALQNHTERLQEDNNRAKELGNLLNTLPWIESVNPVHTNIVIFKLKGLSTADFVEYLKHNDVLATPLDPITMRFVTHMDYTSEMHENVMTLLKKKA